MKQEHSINKAALRRETVMQEEAMKNSVHAVMRIQYITLLAIERLTIFPVIIHLQM
jgi:hypothetical protein